jgi:16S rRNA processing protein RimM
VLAEPHKRVNPKQEKILLGHISGLFGVKGWIKIFSYTSPRVQIVNYKNWYLKTRTDHSDYTLVCVEDGRAHKEGVVAKLQNIDDRDSAATLLQAEIWVDETQLSDLEEGEYYWYQLTGLEVINQQQISFGKVEALIETGANDVLVVRDEDNRETLVPYIREQVIKSVDLDAKLIMVDWDRDF